MLAKLTVEVKDVKRQHCTAAGRIEGRMAVSTIFSARPYFRDFFLLAAKIMG